jgi:16S rRNA (guanine966-N2)-methyltransferase
MRIIAGELRGRKILAPESDQTRPITDRVKQSVFDVLSDLVTDARVYDLFAGTGSLGLECLSRGCKQATFFESDRSALALLRKNINVLKLEDRAKVVAGDVFEPFLKRMEDKEPADILFLDPPYRYLTERPADLRALAENIADRHLSPTGVVVFRHGEEESLELPGLVAADVRDYGSMRVELLRARR